MLSLISLTNFLEKINKDILYHIVKIPQVNGLK